MDSGKMSKKHDKNFKVVILMGVLWWLKYNSTMKRIYCMTLIMCGISFSWHSCVVWTSVDKRKKNTCTAKFSGS